MEDAKLPSSLSSRDLAHLKAQGKKFIIPLDDDNETCNTRLLNYIKETGKKDSDIYNEIGLSRSTFNNFKKGKRISKYAVIAMGLVLNLTIDQINDLLNRQDHGLNPRRNEDKVIIYCLKNDIRKIRKVNAILKDNNCPELSYLYSTIN